MQGYYKLELLFGCTVNGMYGKMRTNGTEKHKKRDMEHMSPFILTGL